MQKLTYTLIPLFPLSIVYLTSRDEVANKSQRLGLDRVQHHTDHRSTRQPGVPLRLRPKGETRGQTDRHAPPQPQHLGFDFPIVPPRSPQRGS